VKHPVNAGRSTGARPTLITPTLLRGWPLPEPDGARGKDGRGAVFVVGGCREVPGAVVLASLAALRAGVGRLQVATPHAVSAAIGVAVPESRVVGLRQRPGGEIHAAGCRRLRADFERHDAVLIGPGMGPDGAAAARALLRAWIDGSAGGALVLDAGGLAALGGRRKRPDRRVRRGPIIVTPHADEMARLWKVDPAEVRAHPIEVASAAAFKLDVVVVLKGEITHIATPAGRIFVNHAGTSGLGTSGSGDVLAGIIAGLCARGAAPEQAAAWAVFVHAKAGEQLSRKIAPLGFIARELLDEIPTLVHRLSR
jgi:ADP-dependent NAD(P)H-hydrate dehydratase